MAIKLTSYLKRNRFGIFCFRRVIPPDLRKFFAFREIERSTRTHDPQEAGQRVLRFRASVDQLFARIRQMANQNDVPNQIRLEMVVELLFDDEGNLKSVKTDAKPAEIEAASLLVPRLITATRGDGTPTLTRRESPLVSSEIDKYLEEQERAGVWRAQSAMDIRGDFSQFKQLFGDIRTAQLDHESLNNLKDKLIRLPANINKNPLTRGKTIDEILSLGFPAQSAVTVRKKWSRLISFFDWLEGKGLVDRNFAKGKKPKAKPQSYDKFTKGDLIALFESDVYSSGKFDEAFQFWLPLLGLYTGARLEELAQLHLADIYRDSVADCYLVKITEEVDDVAGADSEKQLKRLTTARDCPIHPELVTAGFIEYVDELKARGYDRLFPELLPDTYGKVGARASEWFTAYRRSKGVGEATGKSRKVFHSFRHTMNAKLQAAGVPQEIREALCGHKPKAVNTSVYGGKLPVATLKEALEKLDYGIATPSFLSSQRHELARKKARARIDMKVM